MDKKSDFLDSYEKTMTALVIAVMIITAIISVPLLISSLQSNWKYLGVLIALFYASPAFPLSDENDSSYSFGITIAGLCFMVIYTGINYPQ